VRPPATRSRLIANAEQVATTSVRTPGATDGDQDTVPARTASCYSGYSSSGSNPRRGYRAGTFMALCLSVARYSWRHRGAADAEPTELTFLR
jgi:hypothetical protein